MVGERELQTNLAPSFPLSVLLVEDSADDAELCLRVLRKAHFEIRSDVVKTAEEFVNHLRTATYDVVLADYRLGCWTGMDALNLLHQEGHDTPLILVTGALGEQKAVECIKGGVADFILKDRMERLPLAISRALEEKALRREQRRAESLLRDNEAKFRALADAIPAAVFVEQATQCCYVNAAAECITGYSRAELLSMNFWELLLPSSRKALAERATATQDGDERPSRHRVRILTKSGGARSLDVTVGAFKIDGGLAALITAFDVADQEHGREPILDPTAGQTVVRRPYPPLTLQEMSNRLA